MSPVSSVSSPHSHPRIRPTDRQIKRHHCMIRGTLKTQYKRSNPHAPAKAHDTNLPSSTTTHPLPRLDTVHKPATPVPFLWALRRQLNKLVLLFPATAPSARDFSIDDSCVAAPAGGSHLVVSVQTISTDGTHPWVQLHPALTPT